MKKSHVPSLDGIPGIMPGTRFILPEPAEVGSALPNVPSTDGMQAKTTGSKAVKNLNRRMMPSNKK